MRRMYMLQKTELCLSAQACGLHERSYNLPETIRESDIEKLSFAVQLAEGFYADTQASA